MRIMYFVLGSLLFLWSSCQKEPTISINSTNNQGINLPTPQDSIPCSCNGEHHPMGVSLKHPTILHLTVGKTKTFQWQWIIKQDVFYTGFGANEATEYCGFDPTIITMDSTGAFTALSAGQTTIQLCQYQFRRSILVTVVD